MTHIKNNRLVPANSQHEDIIITASMAGAGFSPVSRCERAGRAPGICMCSPSQQAACHIKQASDK